MLFSREWSWLLYLLAGTLVVLYALFVVRNRHLARQLRSRSRSLWVKALLRTTYIALVFLALLGPRFGQSTIELRAAGRDVFLLLDLSQSMLARDIAPTRLARARQAILSLLHRFPQDRFGLIAVGQQAQVLSPLTIDQQALELFIQTVQPQAGNAAGADFAEGISLASQKLSPYLDLEKGTQKAGVIVLVTDGEGLEADALRAARVAARKGITIYGLAIGTGGGATLVDSDGRPVRIDGATVRTTADIDALRDLCLAAGGSAFQINATQNQLEALELALNALQVQTREVRNIDVRADKYVYFLLPALFLLFGDVLFTIKIIKL